MINKRKGKKNSDDIENILKNQTIKFYKGVI